MSEHGNIIALQREQREPTVADLRDVVFGYEQRITRLEGLVLGLLANAGSAAGAERQERKTPGPRR